jgi:hypothetical protein
MTVLERNAATGVELGKMAGIFGSAVLAGAIIFGAVYALNSGSASETLTPAQTEQYNELNKADIGMAPVVASPPFQAGSPAQTHTGRTSPTGAEKAEAADRVQLQKAATEKADAADRVQLQKNAR